MTYRDQLLPWCIIRHLPNLQRRTLIRFRRRSDAEGHLRILQANNPTAAYEIIFDLPLELTHFKGES